MRPLTLAEQQIWPPTVSLAAMLAIEGMHDWSGERHI